MLIKSKIDDLDLILGQLGLKKDESKLYLSMLQLGPKPASTLAKQIGLQRGKTYNLLSKLKAYSIIQEVRKSGSTSFAALPLEVVVNKLNEKMEALTEAETQLKSLIPQLNMSALSELDIATVEFWKGDAALMAMLDRLLLYKNSQIFAFMDYETRWPSGRRASVVKWDQEYTKRRAAENIPIHIICNRSSLSDKAYRNRKKGLRDMKLVNGISIPIAILIHRTNIIITCNGKEVFGVVIRDETVSKAALEIFSSIWKGLKDYSLK